LDLPSFPTRRSSDLRRLGGAERTNELKMEQLTIDDLEAAILDVRENADKIYREIFEEFSYAADLNRNAQPRWKTVARKEMHKQQAIVISDLEEKVKQAPETASDEFMYQDKKEAEKELAVAKQILEQIPQALEEEDLKYRIWNPLPYHRYRGSDE